MENNLKNKAKFFAQHWGQVVLDSERFTLRKGLCSVTHISFDISLLSHTFLELKPLSSITDEDLTGINYTDEYKFMLKNGGIKEMTRDVADYLRSKGYALPYMGLSVEQLIEYGWLKLSE